MVDAQTHSPAARFVGSSVVRKEDRRLLTGHGRYVDDITLHGQLHLAFRRSDVASGRIVSIDTSAAEAVPGVVRVFTAETMNPLHGEAWHGMLGEALVTPPPLAAGTVKYAGDTIACVVATTRYIAEDACDLIEVDIETTPAVVDYRSAAEDTEHLVHADWGLTSNAMVEMPFMAVSADLEEAFAAAAHVVEADIEQNRYICVPMETRGANASWDEGNQEIVIYLSGQSGHGARDYYARYLGIPAANITIELRDVGGGFGPEDVRVPRGERGGAGQPGAGPAGEVDRGPAREPDRRPALPQRVGPRPVGPRRRRHHHRHRLRAQGRRRRLPGLPGGHQHGPAARSVQDPPGRASRWR